MGRRHSRGISNVKSIRPLILCASILPRISPFFVSTVVPLGASIQHDISAVSGIPDGLGADIDDKWPDTASPDCDHWQLHHDCSILSYSYLAFNNITSNPDGQHKHNALHRRLRHLL